MEKKNQNISTLEEFAELLRKELMKSNKNLEILVEENRKNNGVV